MQYLSAERKALDEKIENEKRYFMEKMPPDDCRRLQELETMYGGASFDEDVNTYSHGFILGALLMMEVMEKKEAVISK